MDRELQELERAVHAAPGDEEALEAAHRAWRRAGEVLPVELLVRTRAWRELAAEVARFFSTPLRTHWGKAATAIQAAERRLQLRLPWALREWYWLTGGRPGLGTTPEGHVRIKPPYKIEVRDGLLVFAEADLRRWGIDLVQLEQDPDPPLRLDSDVGEPQGVVFDRLSESFCPLLLTRLIFGALKGERSGLTRTSFSPLVASRPSNLTDRSRSWILSQPLCQDGDAIVALWGEVTVRRLALPNAGFAGWPDAPAAPPKPDWQPVNHHRWFIKMQGGPKSAEDYD